MITEPTVLILGAGVSYPYGYPLGRGLVEQIVSKLGAHRNASLLETAGLDPDNIQAFRNALHLSDLLSIDVFLEHRPEFVNVGKHAISLVLLDCEQAGKLVETPERGRGIYQVLLSKLVAPAEEFTENQLTIITYNYDRSLEHYLFTSLKNMHNRSDQWTAEALASIPIVHVHGCLGPLPWQAKGGRPYRALDPANNRPQAMAEIDVASRGILILSDEHQPTPEFSRAFDAMQVAKKIYFLGFGYDNANVSRLQLERLRMIDPDLPSATQFILERWRTGGLRGSALHLGAAERAHIQRKWKIWLPDNTSDDYAFLKEYAELF